MTMDLLFHRREKEGIQILDLQGRLTEGASEASLRAAILDLVEAKTVNVILNFAGVTEIDAAGVEALVFCDARLVSSGGAQRLLNVSPRHLDLMILTALSTVSQILTDEQDAVNSFFPDRASLRYDILDFVEDPKEHPGPDLAK
jgi:anti-anti-sigma factor